MKHFAMREGRLAPPDSNKKDREAVEVSDVGLNDSYNYKQFKGREIINPKMEPSKPDWMSHI